MAVTALFARSIACAADTRTVVGSGESWRPHESPQKRFKSAIQKFYSSRSTTYDQEGQFHPRMVKLVVELADLRPGHRCLDLCTGTGQVAACASPHIEPGGSLVAVDFSRSMLAVAADKLSSANVTFLHHDVEDLPSSLGIFDRILCASGLVLLRDIPEALHKWRNLLAPDGRLVVDGPSDDAFVPGLLVASAAEEMGLSWPIEQVVGTEQKAVALLEAAGLQLVSFNQQVHETRITLPKLLKSWENITPFVFPATPPELREPLYALYTQKAADYMAGCEEVCKDDTMNFVVATHASAV